MTGIKYFIFAFVSHKFGNGNNVNSCDATQLYYRHDKTESKVWHEGYFHRKFQTKNKSLWIQRTLDNSVFSQTQLVTKYAHNLLTNK